MLSRHTGAVREVIFRTIEHNRPSTFTSGFFGTGQSTAFLTSSSSSSSSSSKEEEEGKKEREYMAKSATCA